MHSLRKMIVWSSFLVFSLSYSILAFASSPAKHLCRPDQRDALWEFKSEFHFSGMAPNEKTQRWLNNTDCCFWDGVSCDLKTGNVIDLDLCGSSLNGSLLSNSGVFKLQHLQSLNLSSNNLAGFLPDSIGNLKHLTVLQLYGCGFFGNIPSSIGNLSYLTHLDLQGNGFTGELPESMGKLNRLTKLLLSTSKLSGNFHHALLNLTELTWIDLRSNNLEGRVPDWLWMSELVYVDISKNALTGFDGPKDAIQTSPLEMLDISSNAFQDPFPLLPNSTRFFSASDNQFSGEIPTTICGLVSLDTLLLSNNGFIGSIPRCFKSFNTMLSLLHLRNNNLSGKFPEESISVGLISLDVSGNQISGELPRSLMNCTRLEFLNVEDNMFNDTFPSWLSLLPDLQFLVIRSNEFHGPIYSLSFPRLRIFDISKNIFTGVMPLDYFANWSAMSSVAYVTDNKQERFMGFSFSNYHKSVVLAIKGSEMELLGSGFRMYKTIDVSGNRLEGDIPQSIGLLKGLIVLNMSNNAFTGHIPPSISNLTNLQSLDLSENRLSGNIPPELGKLSFLALMNFSNNMLEGPIPRGTQIQSQNSSSFAENPGLCGAPLQETCGSGGEEVYEIVKEENDQVLSWIAVAIAYVPAVFCGLTIGHILTLYKPYWFMRIFHSFA
ncbi:hypothetical protein HID58_035499 [Brassica napus]|uniref:Leucine-rich repeat-containing N-terminal plant-type domain-containing protein n=1 Tax=Brassica napus TaxID=3708 RepID=A0ABQ8C595_BRANA|nr:hypothetical protein HID58_035499 [Brassica napus]